MVNPDGLNHGLNMKLIAEPRLKPRNCIKILKYLISRKWIKCVQSQLGLYRDLLYGNHPYIIPISLILYYCIVLYQLGIGWRGNHGKLMLNLRGITRIYVALPKN